MSNYTNTAAARERKSIAIRKLLLATPQSNENIEILSVYADSVSDVPVEVVQQACEVMLSNWTNTYSGPMPGNIYHTCKMLVDSSRRRREHLVDDARIRQQSDNQITHERAQAEIDRLESLSYGEDPYPPVEPDKMGPEFHERVRQKVLVNLRRYLNGGPLQVADEMVQPMATTPIDQLPQEPENQGEWAESEEFVF